MAEALWTTLPDAARTALLSWCELDLASGNAQEQRAQAMMLACRPDVVDQLSHLMQEEDLDEFIAWRGKPSLFERDSE